jgi:short-subunit dehydrogenase
VPEVLVNNAGYGLFGPLASLGIDEQLGMIQLNITTLTHLARLFLPEMIGRRKGFILNVASTAAFSQGR